MNTHLTYPNDVSVDAKDRVQLVLGQTLHNKLKKAAKKEDLNVSQLVRRLVKEYLDKK